MEVLDIRHNFICPRSKILKFTFFSEDYSVECNLCWSIYVIVILSIIYVGILLYSIFCIFQYFLNSQFADTFSAKSFIR